MVRFLYAPFWIGLIYESLLSIKCNSKENICIRKEFSLCCLLRLSSRLLMDIAARKFLLRCGQQQKFFYR